VSLTLRDVVLALFVLNDLASTMILRPRLSADHARVAGDRAYDPVRKAGRAIPSGRTKIDHFKHTIRTLETTPRGQTHWSVREMVKATG
jgi:hypothetical protein